jgi:hypothetical protein
VKRYSACFGLGEFDIEVSLDSPRAIGEYDIPLVEQPEQLRLSDLITFGNKQVAFSVCVLQELLVEAYGIAVSTVRASSQTAHAHLFYAAKNCASHGCRPRLVCCAQSDVPKSQSKFKLVLNITGCTESSSQEKVLERGLASTTFMTHRSLPWDNNLVLQSASYGFVT